MYSYAYGIECLAIKSILSETTIHLYTDTVYNVYDIYNVHGI